MVTQMSLYIKRIMVKEEQKNYENGRKEGTLKIEKIVNRRGDEFD